MGLLRVLLATAVVLQHVGSLFGLTMTGTVVSVETFYIVSGFYMSLILSEKYVGPGSYGLFVSNRFLKIFPIYWGILLLTLIVSFGSLVLTGNGLLLSPYVTDISALSIGARAYLVFVNAVIFGQDTVMFLGLDALGSLSFTSDFMRSSPRLFNFLLVPQAWTLSLELVFYLIAPFLVRRSTAALVAAASVSLGIRLFTYKVMGWQHDPWTYRFFPSEFMFFLAGMVSHRIYSRFRTSISLDVGRIGWFAVVTATLTFQFLPGGGLKWAAYYALVTLALPLVFAATRDLRADRTLGEMSYPIYLSHLLVFAVIGAIPALGAHANSARISVILVTYLLSFILVRYVARPLEDFRQRRVTVTPA